MKVRRDIGSVPLRTAESTWQAIVGLITGPGSRDITQLQAATSVMASLITDELYSDNPMTLVGESHRLVLYCHYGQKALEVGEEIDSLTWNPTEGDWTLFVPCDPDNLPWARRTLKTRAPRITVHELGKTLDADKFESDRGLSNTEAITVDWEKLK